MKICQVGSAFMVYVVITRNAMEYFYVLNHGRCRLLQTDGQIYSSSGTNGTVFDCSNSNLLCSLSVLSFTAKVRILLILTCMPSLSPCVPLL